MIVYLFVVLDDENCYLNCYHVDVIERNIKKYEKNKNKLTHIKKYH